MRLHKEYTDLHNLRDLTNLKYIYAFYFWGFKVMCFKRPRVVCRAEACTDETNTAVLWLPAVRALIFEMICHNRMNSTKKNGYFIIPG